MNPDYMEQQFDPDGERGHVEREKIYRDVNIHHNNSHDAETSPRIVNAYIAKDQSLSELQCEIRMQQCAVKDETCFNGADNARCLTCNKYIVN